MNTPQPGILAPALEHGRFIEFSMLPGREFHFDTRLSQPLCLQKKEGQKHLCYQTNLQKNNMILL